MCLLKSAGDIGELQFDGMLEVSRPFVCCWVFYTGLDNYFKVFDSTILFLHQKTFSNSITGSAVQALMQPKTVHCSWNIHELWFWSDSVLVGFIGLVTGYGC